VQTVLRWLIQAALAIEHMHTHGVLHRDIKPSNLFLNRWQDLKLGDFGLSAVTASGAKLVHAVGTLGYAAPEIMRHKPYDAKSDIYALGCSLYEMATLRSVYDDQHTDVFPVPLPNRYSRDLEKLVQAMISKDPERRPSASEVLAHPLLAPFLGKISTESEIYGELQQREDEAQQLLLKLRMLESKLQRPLPDICDKLNMTSTDSSDGVDEDEDEDVYDPLLSLALPEQLTHRAYESGVNGVRSWSDRDNTKWFQSKMWLDLLPRLPFVLTLIGVGVGGLIHLAYCWIPLWTALALVLAPFLAHEGGYLPSGWTLWPPQMQLQRSFVPCSVVVAPVGALLLASALDDNFLFAATLFLFAACPGLSSLIHHRDKGGGPATAEVLNASVGAVFGLLSASSGVSGLIGLWLVGLVFTITHLAVRRWLAPFLVLLCPPSPK